MRAFLKIIVLTLIAITFVSIASADFTYSFENFTNNDTTNAQIGEDQLFVQVSDYGSSQALFNFINTGPEPSTIAQIYFEDGLGLLSGIDSLIESSGVDFNIETPSNWGIGNQISFTVDYQTTAEKPAPQNGIDPYESLGVVFNISNGFGFDDIIASLDEGFMRIGMHVISIGENQNSEAFVNNGRNIIPAPAAVVLAGIGTAFVSYIRKRKTA